MNYSETIKKLLDKDLISNKSQELLEEYSERLNSNKIPIIFNLRHLRKYLNIKKQNQDNYFGKNRNQLYKTFFIPKKRGGFRKIEAPNQELELRQRWIKDNILDKFKASFNAKGFKKNSSIVDNAKCHCGKRYVLNIDIKNFFPSITYSKIFKLFIYIGYNREVSHLLTQLCTNYKNVLPQGAPTSPTISNLVNIKLDKRLNSFAQTIGGTYTRYADDITISTESNPMRYLETIKKIINDEGYTINNKKTRLQKSGMQQVVTGLIVNKKISVKKEIRKELDNAIYYISKYGIQDHMIHIKCDKSFYKEHLFGLAYFVKMVNAEKGINYLKKLNALEWGY